ncbi:MAG: hypothetical protein CMP16_04070, partial [Rickettsiales bacterium]|nr:hypothetical protein [Rickettsiales bacterium]
MRNHVKNIFLIFYGLFFVSCVYFNTFYNAQNSFNKAIEIIDNDSSKNYKEEQNISNIAKKLLYESISSSNIVINKYPDSKYIDDAIYYIARSYLSLNELYKSEKYFVQLINDYSDSKYYNESRLWLEYIHLKLDLLDLAIKNINSIENDFNNSKKNIDKELWFLLYDLKGDLFIKLQKHEEAFAQFETSLNYLTSKTKKIMMYSKLATISESENKLK